jgi:nucleoside-diphosphate-sugar epimerase
MEMEPIYLVTGATGPTGSFAAQELRKGGAPVRALVHKDDERVNHLKQIGAEIIIADLLDYQAVRAALNGIAAAYFVYPIRSGLVDATAYFAQAALDEGVKAIVNMSRSRRGRTRRATPRGITGSASVCSIEVASRPRTCGRRSLRNGCSITAAAGELRKRGR